MGGFGSLINKVGEFTGLKSPQRQNADMAIGDAEYQEALRNMQSGLTDIQGAGGSLSPHRQKLESQLLSQLGELDDNAALRKQYFMEDMGRGFGTDVQNLARAKGGTGTMAQVMNPSGQMYDAQARQRARGLIDLKGQALQDMGTLGGMYGNLYGVDMNKAGALAGQKNKLAGARLGQQGLMVGGEKDRADNEWNRQQEQYNRFSNTITGLGNAIGKKSAT